jgi:phosphosulfolactate synthase (CoM biosynthesis protein A)
MKLKATLSSVLAAAALTLGAIAPAFAELSPADRAELAKPIVALMPVLMKNEAALNLNAEQKTFFADWMSKMPERREVVEKKIVEMRIELRQVILEGTDREKRDQLIQKIGTEEAHILMMRALCVESVREHLTPAQFKQLVALYESKPR